MNRILRGAVVFAASALVWACSTEPESVEGGVPDQIVSDPTVMFLQLGATEEVLFRLVDQQGTSLQGELAVAPGSAAISVAADDLFRPVYGPDGTLQTNTNNTELRIEVTAAALGATTLTVSGEGETLVIPVTVLPLEISPTLSDAAPDVGEPVVLTAPAGFTFNENSGVTYAAGEPAQILSVDATTITFLPVPGSSGVLTVTNVTPDYAPALSLPFPTTVTTTLTDVSLLSSADPNTAPDFNAPAIGETLILNDNSYAVDQFYHIVVAEAGTILDITVDWGESADIDFWLCDAACTNAGTPGGFGAATGAHPEHLEVTFADPGTYSLQTNLYAGVAPSFQRITITRLAPEVE